MNVVLERGDVRYTYNGVLENGVKDYRMQLKDEYTKRWGDVYYFDNEMQYFGYVTAKSSITVG